MYLPVDMNLIRYFPLLSLNLHFHNFLSSTFHHFNPLISNFHIILLSTFQILIHSTCHKLLLKLKKNVTEKQHE